MDGSRIPWWMVVLLGICGVGLAIWQSSRFKFQVRLGAAALALVYGGMLAFTIGGDPRGAATIRDWLFPDYLLSVLGGFSAVAAVLLTGTPSRRGQVAWFGVMSLSNAGICHVSGLPGFALFLVVVAIGAGGWLAKECWSRPLQFDELWRDASSTSSNDATFSKVGLAAVTGVATAIVLIGTTNFAMHAESGRANLSRRHSALPARQRIHTVLGISSDNKRSTNLFSSFESRPDVFVLASVLALISIASLTSDQGRRSKAD